MTLPALSVSFISVPPLIVPSNVHSIEHCVESELKFSAIPVAPAAITIPPVTVALTPESREPLPLFVGPLT